MGIHTARKEDSPSPRMTAYKNGGVLRLLGSFSAISKYFIRTLDSIRVLGLYMTRLGGLWQQTFEPTKAILSSQSCLNVVGDKVRERELLVVLQYNSQNATTNTVLLH